MRAAHHLMGNDGAHGARIGPVPEYLGIGDADDAEDADLDQVEDVEKPEAEGDIGADEVGETEHQKLMRKLSGTWSRKRTVLNWVMRAGMNSK